MRSFLYDCACAAGIVLFFLVIASLVAVIGAAILVAIPYPFDLPAFGAYALFWGVVGMLLWGPGDGR